MAVVFPILPQGLVLPDIFGLAKLDIEKSGGKEKPYEIRCIHLSSTSSGYPFP
jgi:hypothetical protein